MPTVTFVSLTRHGAAEVEIDGKPHLAELVAGGLQLSVDGHDIRFIPWSEIASIPAAYGIVADGWLLPTRYRDELDAQDRAAGLRASGARADVVKLPN